VISVDKHLLPLGIPIIIAIIIMQITIYLSEDLIEQLEEFANKQDKSRSAVIQEILAEGLQKRTGGTSASELKSFFGSWEMSAKEIKEIRKNRGKDIRLAKLR
jgi:metal-responsive CopG/Arc/MetJ family transcriptional regulator